jgi:K+-sensing histidine kinase KdpD
MASAEGARLLCTKSETHGDKGVRVSISDTGAGISGREIDRIFDPLFTTKADGMGMGLSICRSIIDAHNGQIQVTANTPRGAVFNWSSAQMQKVLRTRPDVSPPGGIAACGLRCYKTPAQRRTVTRLRALR